MKTMLRWFGVAAVAISVAAGGFVVWSKQAERKARDVRRAALLAAEPWRDSDYWRGVSVFSQVSVPQPVWTVFENDPPAPEERKVLANKLSHLAGGRRLIAWSASIDGVTPNPDGWETVVTIRPQLGGTAFSTSKAVETWHVSKDGKARCLNCEAFDGLFMID